ncbi:MAG: helix-turn-helix transcriptional regulator [Albidovulum sp.]|nr:helix-turn-helix transcriptional regulator [Albidovulum sp.]
MTKPSIDPETLKRYRKRFGYSQQRLAYESKVSKRTIARIEAGKSSANSNTVDRISKALDLRPEVLAGRPGSGEREKPSPGFRVIKAPVPENAELAFQMVDKLYGISLLNQIAMAPLFAALLAEGSLEWRQRKLETAKEAYDKLSDADCGYRPFEAAACRAEEGMDAERESIKESDIFGELVTDSSAEQFLELYPTDPFAEYLKSLAARPGYQHIKVLLEADYGEDFDWRGDAWMAKLRLSWSSVKYSVDAMELYRLAGDDEWARMALRRGHVKFADIPKDLLDDDASEKRISWMASKVPPAEREKAEAEAARFEKLAAEINLKL